MGLQILKSGYSRHQFGLQVLSYQGENGITVNLRRMSELNLTVHGPHWSF